MESTGSININEVIIAFEELGGEATTREIQSQVIKNRGGGLPSNYERGGWDSYRKTITQKIHQHCPTNKTKFKGPTYFENTSRGKFRLIENYKSAELVTPYATFMLPEEVSDTEPLYEGIKSPIVVNSFERNAEARKKCIEYYGTRCIVCNFDFEKMYGVIGKDFIYVHHLVPLSEISERYIVDPIQDLRPVCPNCHAIIHRRKPAYTIEEVKKVLKITF